MLLPIDMNPENSIYYYGAYVIQELDDKEINIIDLYHILKGKMNISLMTYSLVLDWLYMIDCARVNEEGSVRLCISKN